MSASTETVLVTGASGFLGAHIVNELLKAGYNVRAVARSVKVAAVQARYVAYGNRVEVVGVDDLVAGDFTAAIKGTHALIHVASPLVGRQDARGTLDAAVKGALNVVSQAVSAGIKKVVVTSSYAALVHPASGADTQKRTISEKDWSDVTEEEVFALSDNAGFVYGSSKALSEKALWKFAEAHPDVNITTILPPYLYGPFAPGFEVKPGDVSAMSTNGFFYQVLSGPAGGPIPALPTSFFVDVREAAKAHVLALNSPPAPEKRVIVCGGTFTWNQVVEHLLKVRPELKSRLPDPKAGPPPPTVLATVDTSKAKELLGIESFNTWEVVVEDTVDDLLRMEASWEVKK